jgi:hypothetical protein
VEDRDLDDLLDTLKRCGAALRDAGIPYMLGGSLAGWARGGPAATKDLDLMLAPEHAEEALRVLTEIGLRPERPPEEWLLKAWDGDVLVDLIFAPTGMPVQEALDRAELLRVRSMELPVMTLEDMLTTQLLALDEHYLNFAKLLAIARALREQIDFEDVRGRTAESAFARAFFVMTDGLGITEGEPAVDRA